MKKEIFDAVITNLLHSKFEEVLAVIRSAEYSDKVNGDRSDLREHFASKFRGHIAELDDACGIYTTGYALVRSMFHWSTCYVRQLQRSWIGKEDGELCALLDWMYNISPTDFLHVGGGVMYRYYQMLCNTEMQDDNYGGVRSILYILSLLTDEQQDKLFKVVSDKYGEKYSKQL